MAKPTTRTATTAKPVTQTATADIGTEIIEAWKEAFKETNEREIRLSDKTIAAVIERAGKQWEDMDDNDKLDLLLKSEEMAAKIATADPGISNLVKRLEGDPAAMKEVDEDIDIALRTKVNKLRIYAHFRRIYTAAELNAMPYPNTDKDTPWLGNYKPDTTVKSTNAGEITVTWSDDFVSTMARGKYYDERLADLKVEENATNASKYYKGWSKHERNPEKSRLTSARNALRNLVRGAIEVHHCYEGIRGMALVDIEWVKTRDPKSFTAMPEKCGTNSPIVQVTTAPKNVYIQSKGDGQSGDTYTIGQLIAFDVQTAIKNGGTLAALKATTAKAPKGPKTGVFNYTGDGSDMDVEQSYTVGNLFTNYVNKTANVATLRGILADPKNEHHKDWCENIQTLIAWLDPIRKQFKKELENATQAKPAPVEEDVAA